MIIIERQVIKKEITISEIGVQLSNPEGLKKLNKFNKDSKNTEWKFIDKDMILGLKPQATWNTNIINIDKVKKLNKYNQLERKVEPLYTLNIDTENSIRAKAYYDGILYNIYDYITQWYDIIEYRFNVKLGYNDLFTDLIKIFDDSKKKNYNSTIDIITQSTDFTKLFSRMSIYYKRAKDTKVTNWVMTDLQVYQALMDINACNWFEGCNIYIVPILKNVPLQLPNHMLNTNFIYIKQPSNIELNTEIYKNINACSCIFNTVYDIEKGYDDFTRTSIECLTQRYKNCLQILSLESNKHYKTSDRTNISCNIDVSKIIALQVNNLVDIENNSGNKIIFNNNLNENICVNLPNINPKAKLIITDDILTLNDRVAIMKYRNRTCIVKKPEKYTDLVDINLLLS